MTSCLCNRIEEPREMYRGDSYVFTSTVLQADGCTPQDITGWRAWFTAKEHVAQLDSQATLRLGSPGTGLVGITILDGLAGLLEIAVPPQATLLCPDTPLRLVYDIQVRDGAQRVYTIEKGALMVHPDVTRAV